MHLVMDKQHSLRREVQRRRHCGAQQMTTAVNTNAQTSNVDVGRTTNPKLRQFGVRVGSSGAVWGLKLSACLFRLSCLCVDAGRNCCQSCSLASGVANQRQCDVSFLFFFAVCVFVVFPHGVLSG